jgi:hypothetical protein
MLRAMLTLVAISLVLIGQSPAFCADNLIDNPVGLPNSLSLTVRTAQQPSMFEGKTSLPDGTEIEVSLTRVRAYEYTRYMAKTATQVLSGKFSTEEFRENGGNLKPGDYVIAVTGRLNDDLRDARAIGDPSENHASQKIVLSGKLYRRASAGPTVEYRAILHVLPDQGAAFTRQDCKGRQELQRSAGSRIVSVDECVRQAQIHVYLTE